MSPKQGQKCVVVTGASTGIGLGTVRILIQQNFHVFGSVRKQSDADRLQEEFGDACTPLLFDICDAPAIKKGADLASHFTCKSSSHQIDPSKASSPDIL